jgi:hypothetical protein
MKEEELIKDLLAKRETLVQEDQEEVDRWIEQLEKAQFTKELSEHFAVKEFIQGLKEEIEVINRQLIENPMLETFTRLHLMDKRDLYTKFIKIFDVDSLKQEIIKQI